MASRLDLDAKLRQILGSDNVYFQPPESLKLKFPCIVYKRTNGDTKYADDSPYSFTIAYQLTYISKDPDPDLDENGKTIIDKIAMHFPMSRYTTHFAKDNMNHDTFIVYY